MKIGIDVSAAFGWRGPARSTRNTVRALIRVDRENQYFLFAPGPTDEYFSKADNVHQVCLPKTKGIPWLNFSLPIAARKYKLDLFFFPANDFWLWKPVKTVIAFRDGSYQLYPKQMFKNKFEELYFKLMMKRLPFIADGLVTVSKHSAALISQNLKIPEDSVKVIYNGIDPVFFDGAVKARDDLGPYILFVGGFEFRKNPERLLAAFKALKSKGFRGRLVLVGSTASNPNLYVDIRKLIAGHGLEKDVKIAGKSSSDRDLAALYKGAKLFVFPSIIESFGVPPLEAMACGCPVAASSAGAIPEVVGEAALLFDPYDIQDMADKMGQILTNQKLREGLIAKGKERIRLFSWEGSAKKLLEIFKTL
ncbi:MAG: glycosyltransferase family 1 protein [Candidatus Margulisiibacteriota bacterium]